MKRAKNRPETTGRVHVPPEWDAHECCVMAFCAADDLYSGAQIDGIQYEQVCLARAIARFEPVVMLSHPYDLNYLRKACGPNVTVVEMDHYDIWTRDTLPTYGYDRSSTRCGISWNFNIWGEKFSGYDNDRRLAEQFTASRGEELIFSDLICEGGALEFDGDGTVMTTKSTLLNSNRNPGLSMTDIEKILQELAGVESIIWLPGEDGGITDGHIDGFARFVRPGLVVAETTDDPLDPEYDILLENLEHLQDQKDARGRSLEIVPIKRPRWHILGECSESFSASYINYYLANNGLITAKFDDPIRDFEALDTLSRLMPDRKVVQIFVDEICEAGGGIHCSTQQIPVKLS
ncbi:agmatine/peptidylarginine deiminase [Hoeflea sp. TYP-13]|uniref:agmatine/peptidylarginine deiminase n=1 Tax=Hoeflea sp. TYP-13 TaxID=3230023 RepID=UPI0034C6D20F